MTPDIRKLLRRSERILRENKKAAADFFAKVAEIKQFLDDKKARKTQTLKVTAPKRRGKKRIAVKRRRQSPGAHVRKHSRKKKGHA
jgi:hypothetical protein